MLRDVRCRLVSVSEPGELYQRVERLVELSHRLLDKNWSWSGKSRDSLQKYEFFSINFCCGVMRKVQRTIFFLWIFAFIIDIIRHQHQHHHQASASDLIYSTKTIRWKWNNKPLRAMFSNVKQNKKYRSVV